MTRVSAIYRSRQVLDPDALGEALSAEVCVIGSGAGGAVTAQVLQAAGFDVLVVEEGRLVTQPEFTMREAEVYPKLYQEGMQRTTADFGIAILQGRAVGGTTVVNWTTSFRTPDDVVACWRERHGIGGFGAADLAPHFQAMEDRLAIAKVDERFMNANNRALFDGFRRMGWQVDTTSRNAHACMNSGYCGMGCPFNAKRSMLVTMLPDALAAGARLLPRARVQRLRQEGGRVAAAEVVLLGADGYAPSGRRVEIRAKTFVLCGGAINTPGVLLRSGIDDGGLVGARTFLHPVVALFVEYPHKIEAWSGAPQSAASHHFAHRGDRVGIFCEVSPVHPLLSANALPGAGAAAAARAARMPYVAAPISLCIDGFHDGAPGGTVKLRPSGAPVLDYELTPALWEAMRFGSERLAEAAFAAGAVKVTTLGEPALELRSPADLPRLDELRWEVSSVPVFSAHQMGGARMGDDARRSVVRSADLRHHRLPNLHVIDGSVFPTSLGVNPQLSIYGLAHLMASRLAAADPRRRPAEVAEAAPAPEGPAGDVYAQRCAPCHGAEGRGDGAAAQGLRVRPRDLTDPTWQASVSDERLEQVITEGGPAAGLDQAMIASPDLRGTAALRALLRRVRALGGR